MQKKMIQVFGWVMAVLIGTGAVTEAVDSTIYYNNGNFGIGTTSPLSSLHVAGPAGQNAMRITSPYSNSLVSSGLIIDIDSGYGTSSRDNFGLKISVTNNRPLSKLI